MLNYCKTCHQPLPNILDNIEHYEIKECDPGYYITREGKVYSSKRNNYLKTTNKRVILMCNRQQKSFKIEDIILKYFKLVPPGVYSPIIEHINGDPFNFSVDNLKVL